VGGGGGEGVGSVPEVFPRCFRAPDPMRTLSFPAVSSSRSSAKFITHLTDAFLTILSQRVKDDNGSNVR